MDANEHVLDGKFMRRLLADELLDLVEETHHHWDGVAPHTYMNGSNPIDTVIRLREIKVMAFLMLPFEHRRPPHHGPPGHHIVDGRLTMSNLP